MKNKTKILGMILPIFLVLTLSLVLVSAGGIGIGTPYWNENPLKMYPGESVTIYLNLQVSKDSPDTVFKAEIKEDGQGIASFVEGDLYQVKSGSTLNVPIQITIPQGIKYGETRIIRVTFAETLSEEVGMVTLQNAVETYFPVKIVTAEESSAYVAPSEEPESMTVWYWIIGALVVLIIILWLARKKK